MPNRSWGIIATLVSLAWFSAGAPPAHAQTPCLSGCDPAQPTAACCLACIGTACAEYDACREFSAEYDECVEDARDKRLGGHCALTRDLLNECRRRRDALQRACRKQLRHRIRQECASGESQKCSISKRAAHKACVRCASVFGTTTTTTTTTTLLGATAQQAGDDDVDCQQRCIRRVAGDCYSECADRCGPDRTALDICQEGCRDAICRYLRLACTDNSDAAADRYRACCRSRDTCEEDIDCETTTTRTTTTRTTTASTSTTTLGFGQTTTTTL